MSDQSAFPKLPTLEAIVTLCKRRGFIFQSSEIYGGYSGFFDYGPLGAELKRNIKDAWWRAMVQEREDIVGLDSTIIMHPQIWRASVAGCVHRPDGTTARGIDGDGIRHRRTALPITCARGNRGSVAGEVRDITLSHAGEAQGGLQCYHRRYHCTNLDHHF